MANKLIDITQLKNFYAKLKNVFAPKNHSHTVYEEQIQWGGGNKSGSYGVVDASMIQQLGANRFAFGNAKGVTVEYSRDGGSTWTDYGLTDIGKIEIFTRFASSNFGIGKNDSSNKATTKYQARITIQTDTFEVYTVLNKFAIYISTNGSGLCWCSIDASTYANPTTWVNFANKVGISGWSGWNVINTTGITTYGNTSTQYRYLRFTFGCASVTNTNYSGLQIYNIFGYGGVGWVTPSNMAKTGSLYDYDYAQNAIFPNQIVAKAFNGELRGNANTATKSTQDSQGQQINTTYIKELSVNGRTLTVTKGDGTDNTLTTQDTTYGVVTTNENGLMSVSDKTKLDGIANNANNYTHPSTHEASMIEQDSSHMFVTYSEKKAWNGKASTEVATQSSNGLLSATDKQRLDKLSSKNMNMNLTSLYSTQLKGGTCQVTLSQNISNFIGLIFETVDNGTKRRLMVWRIPNGNGNATTYPFEYPLAYNCGVYHDANTMINNAIWSVSIGNYSTSSNVITFTSNLLSGTTVSPKPITAIYGFNFI